MTDELFTIGAETDGGNVGKDLAVCVGHAFLLKLQRAQNAMEVYDAGDILQLRLFFFNGGFGIIDDVGGFQQIQFR